MPRNLDELLTELQLGEERLVLAGFSQGAAVAAYTGLSRGVAGVLLMGGPCPPRPQLLPEAWPADRLGSYSRKLFWTFLSIFH